ncbi:MAG: SRPBCC family protein [Bacteroidota bacterium]
MFTSKWMIAALALLAVLAILFLIGRKSAHADITITASPSEVWAVLTDTDKIKDWNPVLIPIKGELKEGETVTYEFHQDDTTSSQMPAKVKRMVASELLNQGGGIPGILTFDHKYILEAVGNNTRVTIHEEYRGVYVPFWNPSPVELAYGRLAKALKDRVLQLKDQGNN